MSAAFVGMFVMVLQEKDESVTKVTTINENYEVQVLVQFEIVGREEKMMWVPKPMSLSCDSYKLWIFSYPIDFCKIQLAMGRFNPGTR